MIGALDPLENHSPHLDEYKRAGIEIHSIDQLALPSDHPMNILAAMSKIAGRLALVDAINKLKQPIDKVVIIGFGAAGQSVFLEAIKQKLNVTVMLRDEKKANEVIKLGGKAALINKNATLPELQHQIKNEIIEASIVITSIRTNNEIAPILITNETLQQMKPGSVVVDLAISEGGNVEGSKHDATLLLGNQIIVTNVSGYPKAEPKEASMLWSQASLLYLQKRCS
jgi:NAD(P) transhydrogenase subunit alpha